ncbi:hypothetical protein [uncultured Clostridium sp.]|uniref:hypothetical protein n=1 Tax=uncultured Clostridium sp. TaxID=59620 RepID=UPI0025DF0185|nr:hypothetical protein [uncultured Clostridium sp.]
MVEEREKEKMKGSLTIEAALIIPFITFLILIIIFISITIYSMLHSSMVINNATTNIVSKWNGSNGTGEFHALDMYKSSDRNSLISEIENVIKKEIDLRIPITVDTYVDIYDGWTVFYDYVTIEVTCDFKMPFEGMFRLFNSDAKLSKKYRKNIQIANSAEGLRVVNYAGNLAESIQQIIKWKLPDGSTVRNIMDVIEKVKEGFGEYFQ